MIASFYHANTQHAGFVIDRSLVWGPFVKQRY